MDSSNKISVTFSVEIDGATREFDLGQILSVPSSGDEVVFESIENSEKITFRVTEVSHLFARHGSEIWQYVTVNGKGWEQ